QIYTLSLHDALPISIFILQRLTPRLWPLLVRTEANRRARRIPSKSAQGFRLFEKIGRGTGASSKGTALTANGDADVMSSIFARQDRKSTRLNSSHVK